jgi:predicted RNA binding protein YcfA (HicA-like mRNA interferase family)
MKVRDAIKLVKAEGWELVRTHGSHRHYHHPSKLGIVTIAGHPSEDLDPKTQASILKQAGLKK